MNNTLRIVVAVAAGAAAGAALGILFAPEKGSELRRKIAEQGKKIANNVKDRFEAKKNEWGEKVKELA
jgi:gas vesicle protein